MIVVVHLDALGQPMVEHQWYIVIHCSLPRKQEPSNCHGCLWIEKQSVDVCPLNLGLVQNVFCLKLREERGVLLELVGVERIVEVAPKQIELKWNCPWQLTDLSVHSEVLAV